MPNDHDNLWGEKIERRERSNAFDLIQNESGVEEIVGQQIPIPSQVIEGPLYGIAQNHQEVISFATRIASSKNICRGG